MNKGFSFETLWVQTYVRFPELVRIYMCISGVVTVMVAIERKAEYSHQSDVVLVLPSF